MYCELGGLVEGNGAADDGQADGELLAATLPGSMGYCCCGYCC